MSVRRCTSIGFSGLLLCFAVALPANDSSLPAGVPVFCADGSSTPCAQVPNALLSLNNGYFGLDNDQAKIDNFSWQMLVALMWPLDANGNPAPSMAGTDANTRRYWETLTSVGELFHASDPGPDCDGSTGRVFRYHRGAKSDILRQVFRKAQQEGNTGPLNAVLQSSNREVPANLQATGQAVTDRNGNYVVYDVRVNEVEADYVTSNKLTTIAGQKAFAAANADKIETALSLPLASATSQGAIEVKLAWRILTDSDDDSRFITHATTLAIPADQTVNGQSACLDVTLGLVGMHVMSKPTGQINNNEWLWSTFEHVDNAPLASDAVQPFDGQKVVTARPSCSAVGGSQTPSGATWSFYNPDCAEQDGSSCKLNQAVGSAPFLWKTDGPPYTPAENLVGGKYGSQVARCYEIYTPTAELNKEWSTKLASSGDSPLQHYMVVGSQWAATPDFPITNPPAWNIPTVPNSFTFTLAPVFLTNTTMETFIQTSDFGSCMACHYTASVPTGKFVKPGLLGRAQDLITNRSFIFLEAWGEF